MGHLKFDPSELEKLNDPGRFESLPPEVIWRASGAKDPRTIVEIGAGTGMFSAAFARLAPHATVYAVDVEPVMIDWMRRERPEVAAGRVVPVLSEERHVPLADAIAELVVMINLHHELADPAAIYSEAHRLLVSGGRVVVVDWARRETPKGPPLAVRATPAVLRRHLEESGFTEVAVDEMALPWHQVATGTRR